MHLEVLVEEPSAEAALTELLPKMLEAGTTFRIIVHQGKRDLLRKLLGRLRGYAHWITNQYRIVVLVDRDRQDCHELKTRRESLAAQAGLRTKTAVRAASPFQVMNRLAIEELEAWFFGDVQAVAAAYPGVSEDLGNRPKYANPDAIAGGTWEALEKALQKAGYHRGGLAKIEAARCIAAHMRPERNRSRSFQVFRNGLLACA
jgi:hypothetical protein